MILSIDLRRFRVQYTTRTLATFVLFAALLTMLLIGELRDRRRVEALEAANGPIHRMDEKIGRDVKDVESDAFRMRK